MDCEKFSQLSFNGAEDSNGVETGSFDNNGDDSQPQSKPRRGYARKSTGGIKKRLRKMKPKMKVPNVSKSKCRPTARKRTGGAARSRMPDAADAIALEGTRDDRARGMGNENREPTASSSNGTGNNDLARFNPLPLANRRSRRYPERIRQSGARHGYLSTLEVDSIQALRRIQASQDCSIPKKDFVSMVKEATMKVCTERGLELFKFNVEALGALQEATEHYMVNLFSDANLCTKHGKRVTLQPRDLMLALRLRGDK